jgi:hypothetical protein
LTDYLYAEVDLLLGLRGLDSAEYKKTWEKAQALVK